MKNKFIRIFAFVLILTGFVFSSFANVKSGYASVYADTAYDLEMHYSEKITVSTIKNISGQSSTRYSYYADDTKLSEGVLGYGVSTLPATHGVHTYRVEQSSWSGDPTIHASGSFNLGVYSWLNITVDTSAINESKEVSVLGATFVETGKYKAFVPDSVSVLMPEAGEGNQLSVKLNDVEQELGNASNGVYTLNLSTISVDTNVVVTYSKATDSTINFANMDAVKYTVNGSELSGNSIVLPENTAVVIKAEPIDSVNYDVRSLVINRNGEATSYSATLDNEVEVSFTTTVGQSSVYNISTEVFYTTNTIRYAGDNGIVSTFFAELGLNYGISLKYTPAGSTTLKTVGGTDLINKGILGGDGVIKDIEHNTEVTLKITLDSSNDNGDSAAQIYDLSNIIIKCNGQEIETTIGGNEDAREVKFIALEGNAYTFDFEKIETRSTLTISDATKSIMTAENSPINAINIVAGDRTYSLTKDNVNSQSMTILKDTNVVVSYDLVEGYSLDVCEISNVIDLVTNDNTNQSTFTSNSIKKSIELNVSVKYTRNTIVLSEFAKKLVTDNKLEVYVGEEALTNSFDIDRSQTVTIRANMTANTTDEISSFTVVYSDQVLTPNEDGVITFVTGENIEYLVNITTTTTENYVGVSSRVSQYISSGIITSLNIDNNAYNNLLIEVEKNKTISIELNIAEDYKIVSFVVAANGNNVEGALNGNVFTFTVDKSTTYTVDAEIITTTNTIVLSDSILTALNNGSLATLLIDGVAIENQNTIVVKKDTVVEVVATPNNKNLVSCITVDEVEYSNVGTYPQYVINFNTTETQSYDLAIELTNATNTITFGGTETVNVSYENGKLGLTSIPRDTLITVVVKPNADMYIVDCGIDGVNCDVNYVDGNAEITFITGVSEDYILNVNSEKMFAASANQYVVNKQDIVLMNEGNEYYKQLVYSNIWDFVFVANADISLNEVSFEYLAGVYNLDLGFKTYNLEFYYPIDRPIMATKADICEYISEVLNGSISANTLQSLISDNIANEIIANLHDFGGVETETVKLIFAGNDRYPATSIKNTVEALDLRETVEIDVNNNVKVVYGSYTDNSYIIDLLLDGKKGVTLNGISLGLNSDLKLASDMVGVEVGNYEVSVIYPASYSYKGAVVKVNIEVVKAEVTVDITNNILNYQLVTDGKVNKDNIINITPNVVIENEIVDHVYFAMGLDIVNGELIARVDLSNVKNTDNVAGQLIIDTAIESAIKLVDSENDGLTLTEFVEFAMNLGQLFGSENLDSNTSYLDQVIELLDQVDQAIDVRVFIVNDGSDITPQNHGIYFVGVVTSDSNYNISADAGYLVITADIVDVKFVENEIENNIRKFEYDGTRKAMHANAYDVNNQVEQGNMTYYYVGVQLDGTTYASNLAPINAGAYSVYAMFNNGTDEVLPSKVGLGIGAMLIVPSDDAEVGVENGVYTYNGNPVSVKAHTTLNNVEAELAYITATLDVNSDFANNGFKSVNGVVNIDFPTRFDDLLQRYFTEEFNNGVDVNTFINLLNKSKETLNAYGYAASFVDNIVEILAQLPNTIITFNDVEMHNPVSAGVYLVGAVVFDANYLPEAGLGVIVIQPEVSTSTLVWNYSDINGIITAPALSKIDMTASLVDESINAEIRYVYFGVDMEGNFTKTTNAEDLTNGAWLQLAYVYDDLASQMGVAMPIARLFVVAPQTVNVEIDGVDANQCIIREYNGEAQSVVATASYLNGSIVDENDIVVVYNGVDCLGNKYCSTLAPVNAGTYSVVAYYINTNNNTINYVGFAFAELIIMPAQAEVVVENAEVCYDGLEHFVDYVADANSEYAFVIVSGNTLNIILPEDWNIVLNSEIVVSEELNNIALLFEAYLPETYMTELKNIIEELVIEFNVEYITFNNTLPVEIGEYYISVIAMNANYEIAVAQAVLTIAEHDLVCHAGQAATCTEAGWVEYFTCNNCNYTTYEEIAALGHNEVVDAAKAPTCTETGLTEGSHCDVCGEIFAQQEVVEKLAHTASDWIVVENSTCTEAGLQHQICMYCNVELATQEVALAPHDTIYHEGKMATCTEFGWHEYYTCKDCNYTTYYRVNALGHNAVVDAAKAPTCSEHGLTEGSHCSECNVVLVEQEIVEKLAHTASAWLVVDRATCTEAGSEHQICTVCRVELETREIPMIAHDTIYHAGEAPTCIDYGWTAYYTCRNCNYTTYEEIAALGHNEVVDAAKAPTCTETGLTEGSHCDVCDTILIEQNIINKLDHTYGDWIIDIQATATTDGRYVRHCMHCDANEYKTIAAYGEETPAEIEVVEGQNGQTIVTEESIENAIKDLAETDKKEIVIAANNSDNTITNVEINVESLQQIVEADSSLTIKTSGIYATFDNDALNSITEAANGNKVWFDLKAVETVELTDAQQDAVKDINVVQVLSLQVMTEMGTVSNFGDGKVKVRIPFAVAEGKSSSDYVMMYIADDGSVQALNTLYANGELIVELDHFSEYVIVEVPTTTNTTLMLIGSLGLALFVILMGYLVVDYVRIKVRKNN